MLLKDKVALVTGASSGLGKATCQLFAKNGARLALAARDENTLKTLADELSNQSARSIAVKTDVTDPEQCRQAVEKTVSEFGQMDVLVNAAGIFAGGSIENTQASDWDKMMDVNLTSVFRMMQLAVPHLEKTRGNIINISSITGLRAFANVLAYCVSKAGLDQLTRCVALDLAPKGIRVNAVNPGVVVTNLHSRGGMEEETYQQFLEHSKTTHPLGRIGAPEDVAESILFLASGKAGWITGETLSIDGGRHLTCFR